MTYRVILTERAEADIDSALTWFKEQGTAQAGGKWLNAMLEAVESLAQHPERCALAAESVDLGIALRELLVGKRRGVYRILFLVESKTVQILRVRHSARDVLQADEL